MDGILQGLCDFPSTSLYLILEVSFVFHIISSRKWFDNRAKNEVLLEMIQSFQSNNGQLVEKINTTERYSINLTELSEIICAVEFNKWNLLESYDRLTDKVSLQEGNMHAIEIMSTNEILSLLDKFDSLESSMKALKQKTGQESPTI